MRISVGSTGNWIGGPDPSERNLTCAATTGSTGIVLIDASTRDNQVINNQLGTETLICQGRGVTLQAARGNRISGNRIVHHRGGILVRSAAFENRLTSNDLYAPGTGLAIDLVAPGGPSQGDGVTPNDPDDGGNRLQNFPVLLSAEIDPPRSATGRAGGLLVRGRLDIQPGPPRPYVIELFANAACDASGHGPGEIRLGAFERELSDPGGVEPDGEAFTIGLAETVPAGTWLTSTATDPDGNTSELSACIEVFIDPIFADGFEPVLAP